jgi:pyruvate ferredoxin oxidoreductase beta subunit
MEAHCLPYIATSNASYPLDLYEKVRKAKAIKGTRFIHVFTPCAPGWQFPYSDTVKIGQLAVETGLVVLYEIQDGIFRLTAASASLARKGQLKPVREYLSLQGRFKDISEGKLAQLQDWVNARWQCYLERASNYQSFTDTTESTA